MAYNHYIICCYPLALLVALKKIVKILGQPLSTLSLSPLQERKYAALNKADIPKTECLKDTIAPWQLVMAGPR